MKLVLLPGMEGTGNLFGPLLKVLPGDIKTQIISYPITGIGESYTAYIDYVSSHLPDDEDFVILGESFSGPIAYEIAARKPPHLKGIIFVVTFLESPSVAGVWFGQWSLALWPQALSIPESALRFWLGEEETSFELIQLLSQAIDKVGINVLQQRLQMVGQLKYEHRNIMMPCLYIGAVNDRIVGREVLSLFRSSIPSLNEYLVDGPHTILQHRPQECVNIIGNFLKTIN